MNNEKGFFLVSLLILLPLILLIAISLLFSAGLTFKRNQRNHLCQKRIMTIQIDQANELNRLLQLNSTARGLRRKRKHADIILKRAQKSLNPKIIAAAKAYQLIVIAEQSLLRAKQKSIITSAKLTLKNRLSESKNHFSKINSFMKVEKSPSSLPVTALQVQTGSPTYKPLPLAEALHTVNMTWTWKLPEAWQGFMNSLNIKDPSLRGHCSGTIRKRSHRWRGELSSLAPTTVGQL